MVPFPPNPSSLFSFFNFSCIEQLTGAKSSVANSCWGILDIFINAVWVEFCANVSHWSIFPNPISWIQRMWVHYLLQNNTSMSHYFRGTSLWSLTIYLFHWKGNAKIECKCCLSPCTRTYWSESLISLFSQSYLLNLENMSSLFVTKTIQVCHIYYFRGTSLWSLTIYLFHWKGNAKIECKWCLSPCTRTY